MPVLILYDKSFFAKWTSLVNIGYQTATSILYRFFLETSEIEHEVVSIGYFTSQEDFHLTWVNHRKFQRKRSLLLNHAKQQWIHKTKSVYWKIFFSYNKRWESRIERWRYYCWSGQISSRRHDIKGILFRFDCSFRCSWSALDDDLFTFNSNWLI